MPVNEPRKRIRASDEERDYVLYLLQQAHAAGRLDVDELGWRQDKALAATFSDEFIDLLEDLPEGQEVVEILRPQVAPPPRGISQVFRMIGSNSDGLTSPSPETSQQSLAILSGKQLMPLRGTRSYTLWSFMGGDTIDLSQVMYPGAVMVIESQAVLGGATIKVPAGVHVVDESNSILGGNTVKKNARGDGSNGTLILRGNSIFGGNTVKLAR